MGSYQRFIYNITIILMCMVSQWASDAMMVGGYSEANRNEDYIVDAANFAVTELGTTDKYSFVRDIDLGSLNSSSNPFKVIVLQAKFQVVAGMNYDLKVGLYSDTTCLGAFNVIIYDRFGDLSVTRFGKEISCDDSDVMREKNDE